MSRTLQYRATTFSLFHDVFYSLSQTSEEPLAAPHVPTFEGLRNGLKVILLEEVFNLEQIARAQAAVDRIDARLDRFVLRVLHAVDDHTGGNTRKQIRKDLLKGHSVGKFRRPVLGRQLQDMADWSATLVKCGVPVLVALAPEADALYQLGKAASTQRDKALSDNRNFRDVGARKQYIDTLNAERNAVEGALTKLQFQDPSLPQDFADGFFYSDPPRDDEETIKDVKELIDELQAQLAEAQARLAKMEQDEAAAAAEAQADKDKEAEIEELEKKAAELLAKAKSLKGK